jgi:hypothetical protein
MARKKYVVGISNPKIGPNVIRKFALDCLEKIEMLEKAKPGSLIYPTMTTTGDGMANITVNPNPDTTNWPGASRTALENNLFSLTVALLRDTQCRIQEALVRNPRVKLLLTNDLERDPCRNPADTRRVICSLKIIPWNKHPFSQYLQLENASRRRGCSRPAGGASCANGGAAIELGGRASL